MADIRDTEITGVFPGDFIIRTAIQQFLEDLRSKPSELDVIWSAFAQDTLTNGQAAYGETQIKEAKEWFLKSEIPVMHNVRVPDNLRSGAFVTLSIGKDVESFNTLGDSHWATETSDNGLPFYTQPFTPAGFDVATGELTLPDSVLDQAPLVVGVTVFTRDGQSFPILEVLAENIIVIGNAGARIDMRDVRLRTPAASYNMDLEGMVARQTYVIGCHSYHEPIHGLYLYSVVLYGLTKFREAYLEARGFQGSYVDIGQFDYDAGLGELGFSRFFQLTGLVHQVWSKGPREQIKVATSRFRVIGGANIPIDIDLTSINDLLWIGELDGLGTSFGGSVLLPTAAAAADLHVYFGTSSSSVLTAEEVELLTIRTATQRQQTFSVTAGVGKFIFFAMPISFGDASFQVGAVVGGFIVATTGLLIEGVAHRLYRSVQSGLGHVTVEVL
jgi:hypothetical protein